MSGWSIYAAARLPVDRWPHTRGSMALPSGSCISGAVGWCATGSGQQGYERQRLLRQAKWFRCALLVAVTSPAPSYVVRLQLGNGRRAEIEMAHLDPLVHLIGALERQP
jgi:hypothetical protein